MLVGIISYLCHALSVLFVGFFMLIPLALLKYLLPFKTIRDHITKWIEIVPYVWITLNAWHAKFLRTLQIDIRGDKNALSKNDWALVLCNHQSWVDVLLLAEFLDDKATLSKCFFKREVFWIPIIGMLCWALDFPAMHRYSKSYLKEHPEKKGKDLETTRIACEKYKHKPTIIINFIEGTRFTPKKHHKQHSPYQYLLKPKAGGVGLVMSCMGHLIQKIVHITFIYPTAKKTFWDYLSNRIGRVVIAVETHSVTPDLIGNYLEDAHYRAHFQHYLNQVWTKKDKLIADVLSE